MQNLMDEKHFNSEEQRAEFLARFPQRQCTDIPGVYDLGHGASMQVQGLTVTLWQEGL